MREAAHEPRRTVSPRQPLGSPRYFHQLLHPVLPAEGGAAKAVGQPVDLLACMPMRHA